MKRIFFFVAAMCFSVTLSALDKIDSHLHLIPDYQQQPWMEPWMTVLERSYTLRELDQELGNTGINQFILVQCDSKASDTEYLLQVAEKEKSVIGVVGWADLTDPWVDFELKRLRKLSPKLCSIRSKLQDYRDRAYMLYPDFLHGLKVVGQNGLTFDILILADQLPYALKLVQLNSKELNWDFSQQKFVLDHFAKPKIGPGGEFSMWALNMKRIAKCPNVWIKLSGMLTQGTQPGMAIDEYYAYFDFLLEHFGVDRLIYGSDYPVCCLAGFNYQDAYQIVKNWMDSRKISKADQDKIFRKNALTAYNIKYES